MYEGAKPFEELNHQLENFVDDVYIPFKKIIIEYTENGQSLSSEEKQQLISKVGILVNEDTTEFQTWLFRI